MAVIILTALGYGSKKHDIGPLSQADIDALPIVLYTPVIDAPVIDAPAEAAAKEEQSAGDLRPAPPSDSFAKPSRKPNRLRLLFSRRRKPAAGSNDASRSATPARALPYPLHALPENLSTCPICLCDYEAPPTDVPDGEEPEYDLLRLLPACGHCLHKVRARALCACLC